jgi:hypothetical protein
MSIVLGDRPNAHIVEVEKIILTYLILEHP